MGRSSGGDVKLLCNEDSNQVVSPLLLVEVKVRRTNMSAGGTTVPGTAELGLLLGLVGTLLGLECRKLVESYAASLGADSHSVVTYERSNPRSAVAIKYIIGVAFAASADSSPAEINTASIASLLLGWMLTNASAIKSRSLEGFVDKAARMLIIVACAESSSVAVPVSVEVKGERNDTLFLAGL